jgi:hypothetical protein
MDLFNEKLPQVQGLSYVDGCMTAEQERFLISKIDEQPWLNDFKRRVQHMGISMITKLAK